MRDQRGDAGSAIYVTSNADRNRDESAVEEGLPDQTQDLPPGMTVETAEEARMMPRDHSIAAGSDPAYPVTAEEQRHPESASDRHAREEPDFGEPRRADASVSESPEESAMHTTRNP